MQTHRKLILFIFTLFITIFGFAQQPVSLTDQGDKVILSNEFVQVTLSKKKTLITSVKYKGLEMIGNQHINWNIVGSDEDDSKVRRLSKKINYSVRINPATNNGERAEVSFSYIYDGDGDANPIDMDMRFALGRGDKGIYLSALLNHRKGYPEFVLGQGRMIVEVNPEVFDYYTVDEKRKRVMATESDVASGIRRNVKEANLLTTGIHKGEVEHKYDYAAILAQTPAWGWTSTRNHVGVWMINPSHEYINGGPTQVGLTGHVPCVLLNHWQDGHYGGATQVFKQDETWEKYIGPFFIYFNAGGDHEVLWKDAIVQSKEQQKLWPYSWVSEKAYPLKQQRGVLSGTIEISDPVVPETKASNLWVGLANTANEDATLNEKKALNWQYEGKHYQFWVKADKNGNFTIPNIRAGKYTLYAFADGILGEFQKKDITIEEGSNTNTGKLKWTPLRYGKQLWEIGTPDRSAAEFRHGDHYWQWGLYMLYPKEFPNDVNFTIGKSDWSKDWNYCQPPVIDSGYNVIRPTVWSINFDLADQKKGTATLRLAICGSRNQVGVNVLVNNVSVGNTGLLPNSGVMHRDGIRGKEEEANLSFDAKLLKKGINTIKLKQINVKNWTFGLLYDYLRLELNESK